MNEHLQKAISDLKQLGIRPGGVLLVHSSLRSLGDFENRAEVITDALLQALGPDGTLLMPALSYVSVTPENPVFDVLNTPSCVGALTEYFRTRPGVQRSVHPTHSVTGIGARADELLSSHHLDTTPVGEHSPFARVKDVDGQILFMGCGLKPNTSMHGIEELVEPPYLYSDYTDFTTIHADGSRSVAHIRCHGFKGWEQRYDRVENVLTAPALRKGRVLEADSYLVNSRDLWDKALHALQGDPLYFIDKVE